MINCKLLAVQTVEHTQAGVKQDVHLDGVVKVLEILLLFGKVILSDALKHCRRSLPSEETLVEQQHPEMPAVPDRVVM